MIVLRRKLVLMVICTLLGASSFNAAHAPIGLAEHLQESTNSLISAIECGNQSAAFNALFFGANPNTTVRSEINGELYLRRPLHMVAENINNLPAEALKGMACMLLVAEADINCYVKEIENEDADYDDFFTPLGLALRRCNYSLASILIDYQEAELDAVVSERRGEYGDGRVDALLNAVDTESHAPTSALDLTPEKLRERYAFVEKLLDVLHAQVKSGDRSMESLKEDIACVIRCESKEFNKNSVSALRFAEEERIAQLLIDAFFRIGTYEELVRLGGPIVKGFLEEGMIGVVRRLIVVHGASLDAYDARATGNFLKEQAIQRRLPAIAAWQEARTAANEAAACPGPSILGKRRHAGDEAATSAASEGYAPDERASEAPEAKRSRHDESAEGKEEK